MRVGFDISQIAHGGGVGVYTNELSKHLVKIKDLDLVFFHSLLRKRYEGTLSNVKEYYIPPTVLEIMFNTLRVFPIENFIGQIDVYHSSDWMQPKTKAKKVTTYHDVIALKYPEWSLPKIVNVHKRRLEIVEKEIDMVIAVSESTKKDLMEITKIPEEKIVVIYEAAAERFKPQSEKEIAEFRKRKNLPEKFVLAIGGRGIRRNLDRVKDVVKDYDLIVTGENSGSISDEEMPLLYASAQVLLYPSLYEGFGLPILEAMSCGTAVMTSNISAMPEIGGDGALYVDPKDTNGMKKALKKIMNDDKFRVDLIKKGFYQAKKFSWEKAAVETAKVYKSLCASNFHSLYEEKVG